MRFATDHCSYSFMHIDNAGQNKAVQGWFNTVVDWSPQ